MLDLAALVLGGVAGVLPKLASPDRVAFAKLRMVIEEQLTNPAATRSSIAAAGMSERHANRLLEREGTSIMHLLAQLRLAESCEALEQSRRTVCDIAHDFGFRHSNFTHLFKQRYGIAPSHYRYAVRVRR